MGDVLGFLDKRMLRSRLLSHLSSKACPSYKRMRTVLWNLENNIKCNKELNDKIKINTTMLYLMDMAMLWWKHKELEIGKGYAPSIYGSRSIVRLERPSSQITLSIRRSEGSGRESR